MKTSDLDRVVFEAFEAVSRESVMKQLKETAHLRKSELDALTKELENAG